MKMKEESLWIAVIIQAVKDVTRKPSTTCTQYDIDSARVFITTPSKDFNMVCNMAGLCPLRTRRKLIAWLTRRGFL